MNQAIVTTAIWIYQCKANWKQCNDFREYKLIGTLWTNLYLSQSSVLVVVMVRNLPGSESFSSRAGFDEIRQSMLLWEWWRNELTMYVFCSDCVLMRWSENTYMVFILVFFLGVLWVSFTAKLLAWVASTVLRAIVQFRLAGFQRLKDVRINFQKVCGVFSLLQID